MKRVNLSKNRTGGWAGTGVALICLLSPLAAQEADDATLGAAEEVAPTAEGTDSTVQDATKEDPTIEATESDAEDTEQPQESTGIEEQSLENGETVVLEQAPNMEVEQLEEMIQVFQRLGNEKMVEDLSKVLLSKDPENALVASLNVPDLEDMSEDLDDIEPSVDDLEAQRAEAAVAAGRHEEAAKILRQLKAENYQGKSFPHQQDLAYALLESGQADAAREAFQELASDAAQSPEDRADARARLVDVRVQADSARAMQLLAKGNPDEAIAMADGLMQSHPGNESAQGLKAELLSKSGRHDDAANFLKNLKKHWNTGPFVFQQALAYAIYESEGRAASEPYFLELAEEGYPEEQRLDAQARIRDFKVERQYEAGLKAIKMGEPDKALRIANTLMQADPSPNEAYELKVLALKAQRNYAEAAELLEQYKRNRFADKPFPMQGELADCYAGMGKFIDAKRAYNAIVDAPSMTGATEVRDAMLALADLAPITDPSVSLYTEFFDESEGSMFRADIEGRTGLLGMHQFAVRAHRDEIKIDDSFLKSGTYERWDASATFTATLPNRHFVDITGGGSEDEFLYGAGVGKHALGELGWKLYFAGNERATDSLSLEALDGRQDAVHFDVSSALDNDWNFEGRFNVRQVEVDGVEIGEGFQADVQFGKTIRHASSVSSGIYVGYVGEFSDFDYATPSAAELRRIGGANDPVAVPAADILESLISEEINRHGIEIIVERQFTPRIAAAVVGGFGWAFEEDEFVYRGGVNVNYKVRENVYIQASIDYDSSGTASSSDSGVFFASIMLRIFF